jgi:hypothetical protein
MFMNAEGGYNNPHFTTCSVVCTKNKEFIIFSRNCTYNTSCSEKIRVTRPLFHHKHHRRKINDMMWTECLDIYFFRPNVLHVIFSVLTWLLNTLLYYIITLINDHTWHTTLCHKTRTGQICSHKVEGRMKQKRGNNSNVDLNNIYMKSHLVIHFHFCVQQ